MIKYAKVIDEKTKLCQVGLGTNAEYYQSIGMTEQDVEQCDWNKQWYLKGFLPVQPEEQVEAKHIAQLKYELKELDAKSARSMRAILAETATEEDRAFLANLEQQAEAKREELKQLGAM